MRIQPALHFFPQHSNAADEGMMPDSQPSTPQRTGFWLLIALLALFAASKVVVYDTLDPDCFWHMRVAAQLHRDGIGPIVDDLSFASNRQPWTPYSWLAELGMKSLWDAGGFRAAVAVTAVTEAAIIVLLAMGCLQAQRTSRYLATIVATAAGAFFILPYLSFRPVTFAFLLLFSIAFLLLRDLKKMNPTPVCEVLRTAGSTAAESGCSEYLTDRRRGVFPGMVWLIVPLTVLLTNIHLFSFFVPAMVMAFAIGAMIEKDLNHVRRYSILATLTTLACLATPMLPGLIKTIFFYSAQDKMVTGPVIVEMQSFFRGTAGAISAVGVIAMLFCIARQYRLMHAGHLICIAVATLLLLKLGRFAPIFALVACPALAATLPAIKDRLLGKPAIIALLGCVVLIGTGRMVLAFPGRSALLSAWVNRHGPDMPGYPCEAADFVERSVDHSTGHLVNEFSWGGYLAWRLQGSYQVLLDGRTQVYPQSLWQATYLGTDQNRRDFLSTVHADAALVPADKSWFRPTLIQLGWTTVYKDARAEVLVPPAAVANLDARK